ncbi:ergothioneine biosynthesis protein EgtC [Sphaerimonospora cavernae]|uniref:Gamma-glutamyl-hercynylcysteine sulfoxide hydrolase n=1 Tax=Sphaerimonospora cavernae TaxID=1740611 RepID=A0ABV6UCE8_9ACTN
MCRQIAYLGDDVLIGSVLSEPVHGLLRQSWRPRRQRYGTVNADGFGVGWYAPWDPVPARYRRSGPIWADPVFADLARVIRTRALLAAVRSATEGTDGGESAAAPFASGRWLFGHNGKVEGWPHAVAKNAAGLPSVALLELEARCDSALVWALVLHRLDAGAAPGPALADTAAELAAAAPGSRLNLLLTDGDTVAATAWGDSLYYLVEPERGAVVVASEPYDDDPRWIEVPDHTLLTATRTDVCLTPLKEPPL